MFQISGHLENFRENMFGAMDVEGAAYRPKPMNCPGHICIYQSRSRSYRDLPIRYAEFGTVYRYERSGVLHGMLRVRGFTQDDAHVFCTPEQVPTRSSVCSIWCTRCSPTSATRTQSSWRRARTKHSAAAKCGAGAGAACRRDEEARQSSSIDEGGGAFYGPKLDFKLIDAIGRKWQGPTVQLDFNLPERFDLEYTGADNAPHRPIMLHRVLVGSMERFVGGLIEHYAGAFPFWLAPEQVRVIPISDDAADAARSVADRLKARGVRVHLDTRNETLNYRIRDAETLKIPYMAVVGKREAENDSIALRIRGAGKKQDVIPVTEFISMLEDQLASRALVP